MRKVFICYSHQDEDELKEILIHLKPLKRHGSIELWNDEKIPVGSNWRDEISNSINNSDIALLVISPGFLASEFIQNTEIPNIFLEKKERGVTIFPLILRQCHWKSFEYLEELQVRPKNAEPVFINEDKYRRDSVMTEITREIESIALAEEMSEIDKNQYSGRNFLTRAEITKIVIDNFYEAAVNDLGEVLSNKDFPSFSDVKPSNEFFEYIEIANKLDILKSESSLYEPKKLVSKAAALKVLLLTADISNTNSNRQYFHDATEHDWFFDYVATACEKGIIDIQASHFSPNQPVDRDEFLEWCQKTMSIA